MKRRISAAGAGIGIVGILATIAIPANAYVYSTCGQWGSWTDGHSTVFADEWGASSGQCLYVNSAGNWTSTSNFTGSGFLVFLVSFFFVFLVFCVFCAFF